MLLRSPFLRKLVWIAIDFLVLMATVYTAAEIRVDGRLALQLFSSIGYWFICASGVLLAYIFGFYEFQDFLKKSSTFIRSLFLLLSFLSLVILVNYFAAKARGGIFGRGILISSVVFFAFYMGLVRWFLAHLYEKYSESSIFYFCVSEARKEQLGAWLKRYSLLGRIIFLAPSELAQVQLKKRDVLVVDLAEEKEKSQAYSILFDLKTRGIRVFSMADFSEQFFSRVPVDFLRIQWFIFESGFSLVANGALIRLKRLGDILISVLMLIVALPFMLLVALGILIESGRPVFYFQTRTGKGRRPFQIIKFRSMVQNAEAQGAVWAKEKDSRITLLGRFIRTTRLDELPQLLNILKGDMSFVGPRPERPEFDSMLEKEIDFYSARYLVRPGLTGWAQVNYPYGASVEDAKEKLQLDLFYIKNYNPLLDIRIILKTIRVVLERMGR